MSYTNVDNVDNDDCNYDVVEVPQVSYVERTVDVPQVHVQEMLLMLILSWKRYTTCRGSMRDVRKCRERTAPSARYEPQGREYHLAS